MNVNDSARQELNDSETNKTATMRDDQRLSVKSILKAPTDYKNIDSLAKLSITERKKSVTFNALQVRPA